ncbi:hypothetical protein Csa_003089 [Cucumis sativus]|uniref:Uncharacterized protein n=1 Tax=Cucumis sativus TaxID=3659 RepID=A0A0A0KKM1_CUCSA|nr:hypothetical protein Csa_003089 [Cucumis sativus]
MRKTLTLHTTLNLSFYILFISPFPPLHYSSFKLHNPPPDLLISSSPDTTPTTTSTTVSPPSPSVASASVFVFLPRFLITVSAFKILDN